MIVYMLCWFCSILRNGVVGSVMAIKHMATTPTRTSKALDSSQLSEKAKKAIPLLGECIEIENEYIIINYGYH